MKMGWVTIQVNDMEESIKFYTETLALKINSRFNTDHGEITFLDAGNTEVELMYNPREEKININKDISIGLEIDDIDKWLERLESHGHVVDRKRIVELPTVTFFFIKDPNGLNVQLYKLKA